MFQCQVLPVRVHLWLTLVVRGFRVFGLGFLGLIPLCDSALPLVYGLPSGLAVPVI